MFGGENKIENKKLNELLSPSIGGVWRGSRGDKYIWGIVVLLAITSLLVVYSATGSLAYKMYKGNTEVYLFRQLSFIVLGLTLIYFLHRVNYTLYSRVSLILYLISVPLLVYTLFFDNSNKKEKHKTNIQLVLISYIAMHSVGVTRFEYIFPLIQC